MPRFFNRPSQLPLTDQIRDAVTKNRSVLVLDIPAETTTENLDDVLAVLRSELAQSKFTEVRLNYLKVKAAKEVSSDLLSAILRLNLQSLTRVTVTGAVIQSSVELIAAIRNNFFVEEIAAKTQKNAGVLDTVTQKSLARNRVLRSYENIEPKKNGVSQTAVYLGSFIWLGILLTGFALVFIPPISALLPLIPHGVQLALVYFGPTVGLIGGQLGMMRFTQVFIDRRSRAYRRGYQHFVDDMPKVAARQDKVIVTLSKAQIAQYNAFVQVLNKVIPQGNIPLLKSADAEISTQEITTQQSLHVSQILQVTRAIQLPDQVTHVSSTVFVEAARITKACGYGVADGSTEPLLKIDQYQMQPPIKFNASSIMQFISTRGSIDVRFGYNPFRLYAARDMGLKLDREGNFTDQMDIRYGKKAITYFDHEVALADIRNNAVMNASLFVNSEQLQSLAIAAIDNASLKKLTLHVANPVTEKDAQQIALILRRKDMRLRKFHLPGATFEKDALLVIQKALAVNGHITDFTYPKVDGAEHDAIQKILVRNKEMVFDGAYYFGALLMGTFLGAGVATFISMGLILLLKGVAPVFMAAVSSTVVFGAGLVIPLLGVVVGAAVGFLYVRSLQQRAEANAELLRKAEIADRDDPSNIQQVTVTASQYISAMKPLNNDQKVKAGLRSYEVGNTLTRRAEHKKPDSDKAAAKATRAIVQSEQPDTRLQPIAMSSARYSLFAQVRSRKVLEQQFKAYSTRAAAEIPDVTLKEIVRCYDGYGDIKFARAKEGVPPAVMAK